MEFWKDKYNKRYLCCNQMKPITARDANGIPFYRCYECQVQWLKEKKQQQQTTVQYNPEPTVIEQVPLNLTVLEKSSK